MLLPLSKDLYAGQGEEKISLLGKEMKNSQSSERERKANEKNSDDLSPQVGEKEKSGIWAFLIDWFSISCWIIWKQYYENSIMTDISAPMNDTVNSQSEMVMFHNNIFLFN